MSEVADESQVQSDSPLIPANSNSKSFKKSLWDQVWMLIWKNFTLKKRRPLSTFSELALPLVVVAILSALRSMDSLQPKEYDVGKRGFEILEFVV